MAFGGSVSVTTLPHTHNQSLTDDGGQLSQTLTDMNGVTLYSLITGASGTETHEFTTAETWTPTDQTGIMEVLVDTTSMTGGAVNITIDGVLSETITTATSNIRLFNPSSSITIQTAAGSVTGLVGFFDYGTTYVPAGALVSVNLGDSGTKLYLSGNSAADNQAIYQYDLASAYDISTASYASISFPDPISGDVRGMDWRDDGTTWVRASDDGAGGGVNKIFAQFNPSSAWDISTSGSIVGSFDFRPFQSGTKDCIWGNSGNQVTSLSDNADLNTYDLGTAYTISTAADSAKDQSLSSIDNLPRSHAWNTNGTRCYYLGSQNDKVYQLDCSTPWDITSMTHTASNDIDVSPETTGPYGIWLSPQVNPDHIYVGSSSSLYKVYQYGTPAFSGTVYASVSQ